MFTHHLSRGEGGYDADKPNSDVDHEPSGSGKVLDDAESNIGSISSSRVAPILSTDTPFFHFDLLSAVRSAEGAVER